ncbi:hypothetical protein H310_14243 [Aphanomyces invadans]|uniref:Uncharacterized protein n=1 Tax=Aphanomyces invadans TaxID=157072 RepID=A0A024TAA0_9STRA|nr:hypothetical protein H310_14243 [Aphanomyces invadans]ETV91080.1 hypothetical protein H310_14243 [Aphanomyces invadans]|eukprot:XP_008880276.1 hypothetical protein H310_14243 [Aphanomyces invadans]
MTTALRETASQLAKAKKPLSDLNQIRQAIKALQKDAAEQLHLELESQATFAYFSTQLGALKQAFETLSDVLMAEVDNVRKDANRRLQALEVEVDRQREQFTSASRELDTVKRTWEVWNLKERDWAKDNEILKASHSHNVEWMQSLQRDVMDTKDRVHELRHDHTNRAKTMADEAATLRTQWQKQVESISDQLHGFEVSAALHQRDLKAFAQQRLDDLHMMEQALSTVQTQQIRLTSAVDDGFHHAQAEVCGVGRKADQLGVKFAAVANQVDALKTQLYALEREQTQRMESVSSMFTVSLP